MQRYDPFLSAKLGVNEGLRTLPSARKWKGSNSGYRYQDVVTSLVSYCMRVISSYFLFVIPSHFRTFAHTLEFRSPLSSLLSEITYNICQRSDTAPLATSRCSNPLEKCPLYYLSEAIYRTLSSLLLFPFVFRLSLRRLHSSPPPFPPTLSVLTRFRPGLNV